jgi:hypothetical protein
MPRSLTSHVYIGIKSSVIALNRKTGAQVWVTRLPTRYKSSASLVNVFRDAEGLFATCAGELCGRSCQRRIIVSCSSQRTSLETSTRLRST